MKKTFRSLLSSVLVLALAACSYVPELPYPDPNDPSHGGGDTDGGLPFTSTSLKDGFTVQTEEGVAWSLGNSYAKASGYADGATTATKTWLVSPAINTKYDGNDTIVVKFDNVLRYVKASTDVKGFHKVLASTDYDGDVTTATWTDLGFEPVESATQDWTFYAGNPVMLPEQFVNKEKVYLAFYFECTADNSTTWELQNLNVCAGSVIDGEGDGTEDALPFTSASLKEGFNVQTIDGIAWSLGNSYAKASGYDSNTKVTAATKTWLISPAINTKYDGNDTIVVKFDNVLRYVKASTDVKGFHKVLASTDYDGDVTTATWTDLGFEPVESATQDWTFYAGKPVVLPEQFVNKEKVYLAFYFECAAENSTTWELQNLYVGEGSASGEGGDKPAVTPDTAVPSTVADFIAHQGDGNWYILTGAIQGLKDGDQWGNFDLVDETGSVYVYGVRSEYNGPKQKFQELVSQYGLKDGDVIKINAQSEYYEKEKKVEAQSAFFVELVSSAQGETVTEVTIDEFNSKEEGDDWYKISGTVSGLTAGDNRGVFTLTDKSGSVSVDGLAAAKGAANDQFQNLVSSKGIIDGCTLTIVGQHGDEDGVIINAYFVSITGGEEKPQPDGENLVSNGGFENWDGTTPIDWKSASTASSATLSQSSDAHSGSYSVCVGGDTNTNGKNRRLACKEITLPAGKYAMSFYAKGVGATTGSVCPGFVPVTDGKVGSYNYGTYANNIPSDSWTKVDHTFELSAETTLCLFITNSKNSKCDVLVDDVTLVAAE